ncbi:MAG: cyclic nucleotide-binding domain-containing protein [Pseudomonadota bacterium]
MPLTDTLAVMRKMPLFRQLDDRRIRVIAMTGQVLRLRTGERLWEKGDPGDSVLIVLSGEADVLFPLPDSPTETSIAVLGEGELVGEMAVLTGRPRSTAIAARSDLEVLQIEGTTVLGLLREFPELALEVIKVLALRLEASNARAV